MSNPLDMKGTIEFYQSIRDRVEGALEFKGNPLEPFNNPTLFEKWSREDYEARGLRIVGNAPCALSDEEIVRTLNLFRVQARERTLVSEVVKMPAMWFEKTDDGTLRSTRNVEYAISPTSIIPSYINFGTQPHPTVQLFDTTQAVQMGILDVPTAKMITMQGLIHEFTHGINWLGRRELYSGMPESPNLLGEEPEGVASAFDWFARFGDDMVWSTPISHYGAFYWKNEGWRVIPLNGDMIQAIDEELAESVAAHILGFAFNDEHTTTNPFKGREHTRRFVSEYLQLKRTTS